MTHFTTGQSLSGTVLSSTVKTLQSVAVGYLGCLPALLQRVSGVDVRVS